MKVKNTSTTHPPFNLTSLSPYPNFTQKISLSFTHNSQSISHSIQATLPKHYVIPRPLRHSSIPSLPYAHTTRGRTYTSTPRQTEHAYTSSHNLHTQDFFLRGEGYSCVFFLCSDVPFSDICLRVVDNLVISFMFRVLIIKINFSYRVYQYVIFRFIFIQRFWCRRNSCCSGTAVLIFKF